MCIRDSANTSESSYNPNYIFEFSESERLAYIAERSVDPAKLANTLSPSLMKALYPGADFSGVPVSSPSNESNNLQAGGKITIQAGGTSGSIGTIASPTTISFSDGFD